MIQPILLDYNLHEDVVAFSTTRRGGFSTGAYGEFNINRYCGDDAEAIRKNRALLCQQLGISDDRLIMPHQVHLAQSARIDEAFLALSEEDRQTRLEGIDAVMTHLTDVCIGVSTADCIPLLVYDPRQHAVAAIHAGWRGTVQRIAQQTIADMTAAYGSQPADLCVQIGPGISLDSFEVGDEVYEAFAREGFPMEQICKRYPTNDDGSKLFTSFPSKARPLDLWSLARQESVAIHSSRFTSKWHIDLPECNRWQLIAAGVPDPHITVADICTVKQSETFFSARRLGIQSGRIFTGIIRKHSNI